MAVLWSVRAKTRLLWVEKRMVKEKVEMHKVKKALIKLLNFFFLPFCSPWKERKDITAYVWTWNSPGQNTRMGSLSLLQGIFPTQWSSQSGEPRFPTLQADSLLAEPQGKPNNTRMGSLSLLQQIFLTKESNRAILHCSWILYQLSYQGSCRGGPNMLKWWKGPLKKENWG